MRSLQWSAEQATHIPGIDAEHQEMFRIAADLRHALLGNDNGGRVDLLCNRLVAEFHEHFSHEERLMKDAEYPAYTWHERQHRTAKAKIAVLEQNAHRRDRQAMFASLESLAGWLRDHTSIADRMIGSYLRNYWRARELARV